MDQDNMQLKISYVNDVNTTYKVIEMGQEHELIDYQVDMIRNNQVEGLLKVDSRFVNNDLHLYYDVTSKQPLEDYMKRIQWGKKETLDFIEQLIQIIVKAESYLLDSSSFVIHTSHMYIDSQTRKLSLLYLPVKMQQSVNKEIKNFLIQWIVYDANFVPNETDTILSQVLNALKNPQFNVNGFHKELAKIQLAQAPPKVEEEKPFVPKVEEKKPESLEHMIHASPKASEVRRAPAVPKASASKKAPQEVIYKTKKRFKRPILLLMIVSQVVLCILLFLFAEKVIAFAGGDTTSYIGLMMFVLVIEAFIFRKVFNIESMEEIQVVVKDKNSKKKKSKNSNAQDSEDHVQGAYQARVEQRVVMNKKAIAYEQIESSPQRVSSIPVYMEPQQSVGANETTLLEPISNESVEETVLLSETPEKPYLTRVGANGTERIDLSKAQFVIGRQQGIVDYTVQDNAVGRMHAEWINENGQYYVKDLNSRNGTFVNDRRLLGDQKERIQPGDVIKLANIDFTFNLDQ